MTNSSLPDMRTRGGSERDGERQQRRGQYLPSTQVLAELAVLGPDLTRLAADLRDRLSDRANTSAS